MKTFRFTGRDGRSFIASGKDVADAIRRASFGTTIGDAVFLNFPVQSAWHRVNTIVQSAQSNPDAVKGWGTNSVGVNMLLLERKLSELEDMLRQARSGNWGLEHVKAYEDAIVECKKMIEKLKSVKVGDSFSGRLSSKLSDADTSTLLGLVQDITEFVHNNFDRLKGKTLTEIQKEYERFKGQSWKQLPNAMMLASINFGW